MPGHDDIRIGTLVKAGPNCANYIRQILPRGFESVQLTFSFPLAGLELRGLADELLRILDDDGRGAIVSSLGLYGNALIDPLPQLRKWAHKVFHVHGKDATVFWDTIRTWGIRGGVQYMHHRTPGFGDTNWTDVISTLRLAGYRGSIDIEGWHDPVYKGDLEMTGQVRALHYLKQCRGGDYIPNPT